MIFGTAGLGALVALMATVSPLSASAQTAPQDDPYSAPDPYAQPRPATPAVPAAPAYDPGDPAARDAFLRARGETSHRAPDEQQTEEELRQTRALNDEIVAQNALAASQEDAERLSYDAAVLRHRLEAERVEAERQLAADAARAAQEQYDRDYATWQARVRACEAGQRAACAPPAPRRY